MIFVYMAHLAIFISILSLPLGVMAIYRLFQAYKRYNQRYLFTYGFMLVLMNFGVIISLINNYLFTNVFIRYGSSTAIIFEIIYRFTASLIYIICTWVFVVLFRKLLGKKITKLFKILYFGTGIPLVCILFFYFITSLINIDVFPILWVHWTIIFMVLNVIMWSIIYLIRRNYQQRENKGRYKAIKIFGYALLGSFSVFILASFLLLFQLVERSVFPLGAAVFLIVLYGMPVFYLKQFLDTYHGPLEKMQLEQNRIELLYKKHNISQREQEIIELICKGRSNKQIEDELFIALQTVKDHVSRIYHKTGVKNRVQLTNLFRN